MTVGDLRCFLASYPDDMEILETRYSDYGPMEWTSWCVVTGVVKATGRYGWFMRSHPTMSDENKAREKTYLHYEGN